MTSIKNISHLFLSKKNREEVTSPLKNGDKTLHTILIAGLSSQFASINFGSNLAKKLSKKIGTVFLFNIGHELTNCPLMSQYVNNGKGEDEIRVESIIDNFRSGKDFVNIYNNLTHTNLLLINYPDAAVHELPGEYLGICNDIILLITPDSDTRMICSFVRDISMINSALAIKIGITNSDSSTEAESIYGDIAFKLRDKTDTEIAFLGNLPSFTVPQQAILGDRVINLVRPDTIKSMEESFKRISENLLTSINNQGTPQKSLDVFNALKKLLIHNNSEHKVFGSQTSWPHVWPWEMDDKSSEI